MNSLLTAIDLVLRDMQFGGSRVLDNESRERFERILYSMAEKPEDDPYLRDLTKAIAEMEAIARPYLVR